MRVTCIVLAAVGVMASAPSMVKANAKSDAQSLLNQGIALARAVNVQEETKGGLVLAIAKMMGTQVATQEQYDCVMSSDVSFADHVYGAAFAAALSPQELKDAVTFYNTPAGKLSLDPSKLPTTDPAKIDTLPQEDIEKLVLIAQFQWSSAYKKLTSKAHVTPQFQRALVEKSQPIILACSASSSGRR